MAEIILNTLKNMTGKEVGSVIARIAKYKKLLAADKKQWGGYYHDGQGIRYLLPEQFIKIKDYKGGLKYLKWFYKTFPDDIGDPVFLFECTFILFKCNKIEEAEEKAHKTFFSNTYLFDRFLGKESLQIDKNETSNWKYKAIVKHFIYSGRNMEFEAFASWTEAILNKKAFLYKANKFLQIERALENEPVGQKRSRLVNRLSKIKYG